jgi:hypothetical protein
VDTALSTQAKDLVSMRKLLKSFILIAAVVFTQSGAQAGDAKTIRIEPRAFYGATVSLESGVRVFRPLPPPGYVIINPNQTPVNINVEDVTKRIESTSHHHYHGAPGVAGGGRAVGGYLPYANRFRGKRRHVGKRHPQFGANRGGLRGGKGGRR